MKPHWTTDTAKCSAPRCSAPSVLTTGHGPRCAVHHCADLGRPLDPEERAA